MVHSTPSTKVLLNTVYFIYFFCGLSLCFEGAFNPEIKEYFNLTYSEQMLTFFAKNIPFIIFSVIIGIISTKIGFKNCLTISMLLFALGTYLLIPGLESGQYWIVLVAFFIIGIAFNFELVAGNPLLSGLGDPAGSSSRLNLGNALGAIAQIIAPLIITIIVPVTVVSVGDKLPYIKMIFAAIAIMLLLTGLFTLVVKNVNILEKPKKEQETDKIENASDKKIWSYPIVFIGFITIFFAIGTEAGIFGLYRNFLEDKDISGFTSHDSQRMFTLYFAIFAIGRLAGSYFQKKFHPIRTLIFNAIAALILLPIVIFTKGTISVISLTLTGFFISIFFPTLYSISIAGLGNLTGKASGILTMGMLGAALLPYFQGKIADNISLQWSFAIGAVSHLIVLFFALKGYKIRKAR